MYLLDRSEVGNCLFSNASGHDTILLSEKAGAYERNRADKELAELRSVEYVLSHPEG